MFEETSGYMADENSDPPARQSNREMLQERKAAILKSRTLP